ncbi:TonB-dependent receptor domain-containing protein [Cellvibrio sp. QJXJ]|uniref:TonB-dependent receptor domain-containing protein n=1 Tax=Cellvibrio sp. QJXJ TaxID=2964606 RepID=UPI0021C3245B|nr:TonB-dependent receptor [Cellvibrio sp. QJXJ]UUA74476.1 TonB-dependent receptor [Cellvibrio sp. QJXJ]
MFTKNALHLAITTTKVSLTKYLLPLGSTLLLLSPSALSQTGNPNSASEIEELVVVGSRIRQTNLKTISPTQMITRESAATAGLNSTVDLLQSNALTGGASQINNAYGGYVTNGGPGANTISLRGLGASRTLVLINGRRVAPSGTQGAVGTADLNVLPTAMIERVEVLRDGASSIYGSDAVSGVINVITREAVEGWAIEGDFNYPTEGDGEQIRLSLSGGMNEERFSLSGSFDYYERKPLTLGDRKWTRCNQDKLRDPQTGESADFIDPNTGKSKCYPITTTGSNGVTINTIGTQGVTADNWDTLGLNGPVVGGPGSSGTTFTRFRPNASVTTGVIGYEGVGGGTNDLNVRDTFEQRMLNEDLISPAKTYTGFLQSKYDLQTLGDAQLYAELLASRRESNQTSYRQLSMDYRRGSPLIPSELAYGDFAADQGTSDGERVGVRAFVGFGNDSSVQEIDFYKPTIGIRGDLTFLPDWRYDIYASYAKSDASYERDSFLIDKLTYASDAISAPAGVDPTLIRDGLTCEINLTNPDEKCIPYPHLTAAVVGGELPQDFKDYIFRNTQGSTEYEESIFSAIIDGPLFNVPAGSVQGVFGIEHRRMEINDQPDANSIAGNLFNLSSATPTIGDDNVNEIYTEIQIPILLGARFAEELTLNGSIRYTDYDSYGSDDTYKIGFIYSPTDWISLRASRGTSFRAPALFEQFQGPTSGFRSASLDPCNEYGADGINPNRAANCALELPGQPEFLATNGVEVFSLGGADAGLFAETSDNTTYGIIFTPTLGDSTDLSISIDYFDIQINNGVQKAGEDEILDRCYDSADFAADKGLCRLVRRDPVTKQLTVNDTYTNLATEIVRGLDINTTLSQELGAGTVSLNLSLTRYYEQSSKLFSDDPLEEFNGSLESPEFGGSGEIGYAIDSWKFTYGVDWISSMDGYAEADEDPAESFSDYRVPSYLEHRLSARYQADNWKTTVGVRNLTNETPPEISAGYYNRVGNSPLYSGYDYVGREVFISFQVQY